MQFRAASANDGVVVKRCDRCNQPLVTRTVDLSRDVDGRVFLATLPAQSCRVCGEASYEPAVLQLFDLHIAQHLAEAGVGSGAVFRFMRKALRLRAVDLALLLDVSPETLSRWETGKRSLDRGAFAVLAAAVRDALAGTTATLDTLRALGAPRTLQKRVHLDLTSVRGRA